MRVSSAMRRSALAAVPFVLAAGAAIEVVRATSQQAKLTGDDSGAGDAVGYSVAITAKGLDLSEIAPGGNSVLISAGVGADQRAVLIRMGRIGNLMKY